MKWGELKLNTLKKLDPSISSLAITSTTKDYLNSIVEVANRGLQDIATAGKFLTGQKNIFIPKVTNLLGTELEEVIYHEEDITYEAKGKSVYFEANGGTCAIYENDTLKFEVETSYGDFICHKYIFSDIADNATLKLVFTGGYYQIRNVAIYKELYPAADNVPSFTSEKRLNLKSLITDFYKVVNENDFNLEGDSVIVVPGTKENNLDIRYYKYPQTITQNTPDSEEMALDPEVANILPLYIASELAEDDDTSVAFYFREQYQEAKRQLSPNSEETRTTFEDVWGW